LAARRLLTALDLPSWPHSDILTNTVVQVVVDADGDTLSSTPLKSCGLSEADQFALKTAASARFLSARKPGQPAVPLSWGKMIFQWHTVPAESTNSAPAALR